MRRAVAALVLAAFLPGAPRASVAQPKTVTIGGHVLGASGTFAVYVALWGADGFLVRPVRQIKLPAGADRVFRFETPAGRWAISAFEDRNGNGVLDMGLFGPKEPTGFGRAFNGWHKPRFDEVASQVERDVADADVRLK